MVYIPCPFFCCCFCFVFGMVTAFPGSGSITMGEGQPRTLRGLGARGYFLPSIDSRAPLHGSLTGDTVALWLLSVSFFSFSFGTVTGACQLASVLLCGSGAQGWCVLCLELGALPAGPPPLCGSLTLGPAIAGGLSKGTIPCPVPLFSAAAPGLFTTL